MHAQLTHKTPGGKLVRLQIEYSHFDVEKVKIMGDFFLHPEESIGDLESALIHFSRDISVERLMQKMDAALAIRSAQLVGIDTRTLATLICTAIKPTESTNDFDY